MEKLRSKTFYTIFYIISLFIIIVLSFFNVQYYQKEYQGIKNNLNRIDNFINIDKKPNDKKFENEVTNIDLNNRIIMDYNFYTILLDKNNNIIDKISHNENNFSESILTEAKEIIDTEETDGIKINFLYFGKFSYNFQSGEFLNIVDTSSIQKRLLYILVLSIVLFIIVEIINYFVSKKITDWISKPVEDSFNKQKEFIANASHELKTPLSVIMASVDCLEVNKKNEKWLNNLKSESDRMNNLITRLLDLSKSECSLNSDAYTLNNLSKIVEKRALIFESLAFENNVGIECTIDKDIMFRCNSSEIDELVGIILDNAIKHSFSNSKIKVNLYRVKNNIILDIINNGKDIPEDECSKIFERFYRSDKSRNRNSNRYGLGLAIAKNIVNNHKGDIKAFSSNGYTTFRVSFKIKDH